jgi:AcrR family transcriptional regulator
MLCRDMPKLRRTQEERSATTRAALLEATIECLSELGYARTTTVEIVRRAGVSRGAHLHHFRTKEELVTSAVEHIFALREREFRIAFSQVPAGPGRAVAAVDLLWSMFQGATFHAWLEVSVAARTDKALRRTVQAITRRFALTVRDTFHELFAVPASQAGLVDVAPTFTFALLEGLALDRMILGDEPRIETALARFKMLAALVLPS